MLARWLVGIVLLFVILLMMLPKTDEQSLSRIGSASMLACTKTFRQEVSVQVLDKKPVTTTFNNTCPDLIATLQVDTSGAMLITGNKYPVRMQLQPVVENAKVRWSCNGEPIEMVTKLCKP